MWEHLLSDRDMAKKKILTENESQAEATPSQMNQAAKPAKTAKTSGPGHPNPTKGQTRSRRLKQPR